MKDEEKYRELLEHQSSASNDELGEFFVNSGHAKIPTGKGKEKIWREIESKLEADPTKQSNWLYMGIAAAITLAISFTILFQQPGEDVNISTDIGESIVHKLPDGSIATMNANSFLTYSEDWNRTLELSGEAFFEVEKGEKFTVSTVNGDVEVLGTSFNVFSRNGNLDVECRTGKVKVIVPSKSFDQVIIPGEMISFRADTVKKTLRNPELIGRWKSGEFYFNDQPVSEVMDELKRQFRIQIEFKGSNEIAFNGYFTNKNLDQALDMVCLPLGLSYEKISASRVVISESE